MVDFWILYHNTYAFFLGFCGSCCIILLFPSIRMGIIHKLLVVPRLLLLPLTIICMGICMLWLPFFAFIMFSPFLHYAQAYDLTIRSCGTANWWTSWTLNLWPYNDPEMLMSPTGFTVAIVIPLVGVLGWAYWFFNRTKIREWFQDEENQR